MTEVENSLAVEQMEVDKNPIPSVETMKPTKSANLPWVEKYRPKKLIDIVGNDDVIENLESLVKYGNAPNVLISGPPGVGKTTTVLCFAKAILGDYMKNGALELNASNDRGIEVIRNKIKMFAQKKLSLPAGRHKLIILDEADSMTEQAQQALRRMMEIYSNTTRFILACNTSENIIEPIQSRCVVLRYEKLSDAEVLAKVLQVCDKENISYTDDGMEAILFTAQGDLRQALNNLQSTHNGFGHVNSKNVFKVCDEPHPSLIIKMVEYCTQGNFSSAFPILQYLWNLGYSGDDLIGIIFRICKTYSMDELLRLDYIKEISDIQSDIISGFSSFLQLNNLLAKLCKRALK